MKAFNSKLLLWANLACCLLIIGFYHLSSQLDPLKENHHLRLSKNTNIGLFQGWVWVFNGDIPYMGSIISITDGHELQVRRKIFAFDFPGIYCRWIKAQKYNIRSLSVSLVWPFCIVSLPLLVRLVTVVRRKRASANDTHG